MIISGLNHLLVGVKKFSKILDNECAYDVSENSKIANPWNADKSGWRNTTWQSILGVKIDPQNFESYFAPQAFCEKRQKAHQTKALINPNQSMEWTGSIRWIHNPVQSRRIWIGLDQKFANSADSGLDLIQKCATCIPYLETRGNFSLS